MWKKKFHIRHQDLTLNYTSFYEDKTYPLEIAMIHKGVGLLLLDIFGVWIIKMFPYIRGRRVLSQSKAI